ncbi:MAG: hypothetical protein G3M78_04380 [Candidatus Nitrohelix vancouverensis]|uniref:Uncharacterized protein n=1 Tax=Candidatus Nitrohelix vancouverensis TaxID=2705534 RepID=A0A7T0G2X2_9BACT|nr:MAG: hypothetical protein G3M78_04380 [Candidatus Nitrohelix vancouverensis]
MVDPISSISRSFLRPQTTDIRSKSDETPGGSAQTDSTEFSSERLVDAVRSQTRVLKKELPGLISQALLAPATDTATRSQPLNALLFKLDNPLDSLLRQVSEGELNEDLIGRLQSEVQGLKGQIPQFADNEILSSLALGSETSGPLQEILNSLSGQLGDLSGRLEQALLRTRGSA